MKFPSEVRTTYSEIVIGDYFDGACPCCPAPDLKIRSSRIRTVPDLGSPLEKRIARIKVVTFECKSCGTQFTPEHPEYPPKFEYSLAILKYALDCYYQYNLSGTAIARILHDLHQVDVPVDIVNSWIKLLSAAYFKARPAKIPQPDSSPPKTVTVDGTFTSVGREIIGKKKHVDLLSVTSTKSGTYLLTWSRKKTSPMPPRSWSS